MKSGLFALLVFAVAAFAQSNLPALTPEQLAAQEEMRRSFDAAQARALAREALLATSAVPQFDTNRLDRLITNTPPFYNRTNMTPGIGVQIRAMEKYFPGISTNFTPEQLALTNPPAFTNRPPFYNTNVVAPGFGTHLQVLEEYLPGISTNYTPEQRAMTSSRPIIRATIGDDGKIVYLSTNPPGVVTRRAPLVNANAMVPIQSLEFLEREFPGFRANLTPQQIYDPYTNEAVSLTREWFRTNQALPEYIKSTDPNFRLLLEEWGRTNVPPKTLPDRPVRQPGR